MQAHFGVGRVDVGKDSILKLGRHLNAQRWSKEATSSDPPVLWLAGIGS